ncbi:methyltransferase domain-containing protein [candidate division GN15 bacterium]|nr:methyltransferase domain-containing protein [candidate division GN15 bacterium]
MGLRERMDKIYRDLPLESIPWNLERPPALLVEAVESGIVRPCPTVDLGCGAGNYAVWLAKQGFEVTGLDMSDEAVSHARKLAERVGVDCRFDVLDLLEDVSPYEAQFDFAYEWELLHHIFPDDRCNYVENVARMLRPGGLYLSVCFSEDDVAFGGEGKYRDTPLGTRLYFSSEREVREVFESRFDVVELRTAEIAGKRGNHIVNVAWLRRQ